MVFTENNLIIARMVKGGGTMVVTLDSQTEDSPHISILQKKLQGNLRVRGPNIFWLSPL